MNIYSVFIFFCKQKTAYEMRISDWGSDVCSSDLVDEEVEDIVVEEAVHPQLELSPGVGAVLHRPFIGAPHAMAVEVGVVAEADAHRHQSEGNRESEKNDDDEYAQHEEGDLRKIGRASCRESVGKYV